MAVQVQGVGKSKNFRVPSCLLMTCFQGTDFDILDQVYVRFMWQGPVKNATRMSAQHKNQSIAKNRWKPKNEKDRVVQNFTSFLLKWSKLFGYQKKYFSTSRNHFYLRKRCLKYQGPKRTEVVRSHIQQPTERRMCYSDGGRSSKDSFSMNRFQKKKSYRTSTEASN